MMIVAALIGLALLIALMIPFVYGAGGRLQAGSAVVSPEQLKSQKQALIRQYIADEKAFHDGHLTSREWKGRQNFILGRYMDAARRMDYLAFIKKISSNAVLILVTSAFSLGGLSFSSRASAQTPPVFLGERHLIMLKPGVDAVWGTSVFAVINESAEPKSEKFHVLVPRETVNFAPQEGVLPEELKQDVNGLLYVEKEFAPGTNVIGVGFTIAGKSGGAEMSFVGPPGEPRQVAILSTPGFLDLKSDGLRPAKPEEALPASGYDQYILNNPLAAGAVVTVAMHGIPEGRRNFWILGGSVAGMIFLLGGALAYRTRSEAV